MTKSQHTSAPWEYTQDHKFRISAKGRTRLIASCSFGLNYNETGDIMPAEAEANARLIAAAPELLAALEAINMWMKGYGTKTQSEIQHEYIIPVLNKIKE